MIDVTTYRDNPRAAAVRTGSLDLCKRSLRYLSDKKTKQRIVAAKTSLNSKTGEKFLTPVLMVPLLMGSRVVIGREYYG